MLPEGRPKKLTKFASSRAERAAEAGISHYQQQKLDALARQRPDLLEQVKAGTMSTHAAALAAGIVKPPDQLKILKRAWQAASEEQRAEFEEYIAVWRRDT